MSRHDIVVPMRRHVLRRINVHCSRIVSIAFENRKTLSSLLRLLCRPCASVNEIYD